jgi:PAS domain S-box-containing protein
MSEKRIRVLFVDDEEGNLKAFKATFRREWDVLLANSGEAALELLDREQVDVIVSDQRMPGLQGDAFLAIAREHHPRTMRMLLTGYADLEAVVSAVNKGGIYAYATKPWDENDLKLRIEQAYEVQQLRDEKDKLLHQYQQVFDASGDPIVLVDGRGLILTANEACAKLIGMDRAALMRTPFTTHLEDPAELLRGLKGRREGSEFLNVDLTLRNQQGDLIDCLMTATYMGRQGQHKDVFQAIIKDISDRKQEEKHLRKLNSDLDKRVAVRTRQLLEAMEDLGSFSYSVAHDLRSPLKNIAALTDHLHVHAQENKDEEACAFTERIAKGAQRMIDLVDDLLRFSQTNNRELECGPVDLHTLMTNVIDDQVMTERQAQVSIDVAPGARVLADAPMLKVVLHNLLSNALKFSRTSDAPRIVLAHREEDDRDIISVSDNGVGFDPKHKEQVFGAFKRLHQAEQFEGTGVGLAIVHRIITKHQGQVWAESAEGKGTTIFLALPKTHSVKNVLPFAKAG